MTLVTTSSRLLFRFTKKELPEMDWFGTHITLWNNAYNCTMNDPMAYVGKRGMRYLLAKIRYEINRRVLRRILGNTELPQGLIASERAVEIPLAVDFLDRYIRDEDVLELGCVLPYYIFTAPNHLVYDLLDPHPANTPKDLRDMTDRDFKTNIISISTIEHINLNDLGITQNSITAIDVLKRIRTNAKRYFVTFPLGYNPELDRYVFDNVTEAVFVTRKSENKNDWETVSDRTSLTKEQKKFGGYCCANTACVVTSCR